MLFMDLSMDSTSLWQGVLCLNGVPAGSEPSIPFAGKLIFLDTLFPTDASQAQDPSWELLGTRFLLMYLQDGQDNLVVPTQPVPWQEFNVVLGGQNCTVALRERAAGPGDQDFALDGQWADDYAQGYYQEFP